MAHTMFQREFGLMPALVRGVDPGDQERRRTVAEHIEIVTAPFLKHLHAGDTYLMPKLLQRARPQQHEMIRTAAGHLTQMETVTSDLLAVLGEWRLNGTSGHRLADFLDDLVARVKVHADLMEEHLIPLFDEHITTTEWVEMIGTEAAGMPTRIMPVSFGMMMYEADPALIDGMFAGMPADVRLVLKEVASKAFAAHSTTVHGTAAPPRARAGDQGARRAE
ncbi:MULTISPECIES: hemerythrin domain-containing protein [unclassified Streptomyces]|uniref:hemerythrin domain-containing protein n=1 Tax=unclassified Streptomyces TaxID=2593676 RepID=UPI0036ED1AD3